MRTEIRNEHIRIIHDSEAEMWQYLINTFKNSHWGFAYPELIEKLERLKRKAEKQEGRLNK